MRTLYLGILILLASSPALYLSNQPAFAKGVCTGIEPRYIRLEDGVLSSQSIQTGENVTITGKLASLTDKTLQGKFLFYSEPGTDGKWAVLSTTPSGGFVIPGNSIISYSITAKAMFPGRYHLEAGIDLVGLGRSLINNGCPAPDNIKVRGNPICTTFPVAVIKAEDNTPACVRYTTANSLIERGWATKIVPDMASLGSVVTIPINSSIVRYGFTFTPQTVKVVIGTNNTIRWINMDSATNDVTSNTGSFSSGLIEPGFVWVHTFDKPGSYGYHSVVHPWLKGTVIVTANPLAALANDTGLITIGNRTYYFETSYTNDAYSHPVQISFHDVVFTLFPNGFRGGLPSSCGIQYYWTDAKFLDDSSELLYIFAGPKCPAPPLPTYFSTHANPQAGLTFYDGKMKLLVSTDLQNTMNTQSANPLGVTALVIYHPPLACIGPCPPSSFYLKINSNSSAYLFGYEICDATSCVKNGTLSIHLPLNSILKPNYAQVWLPVGIKWNDGDTVHIQLRVSPMPDNKTPATLDLGNSTIVP